MKKASSMADSQLSNIRWILDIEAPMRTQDHCEALIKFLKQGDYLKESDFSSSDLTEFAKNLDKQCLAENVVIFKEGQMGENFYIILKGKIEGYKTKNGVEYDSFFLSAPKGFGDIALREGYRRTCSIRTCVACEFLIVKRSNYRRYFGKKRKLQVKETRQFFEENMLIRSLSNEVKSTLANKSETGNAPANKILQFQGQRVEKLYFISKGGVKIIRKLRKRDLKNMELTPEYKRELKALPEEISLDVQTFYKGSQFGEYEFLKAVPAMNEVVTILPTTLIWILKRSMDEVPTEDSELMLNNVDIPQSNEEVMRIYLENSYWKRYKKVMVGNVLSNRLDQTASKNYLLRTGRSRYKVPKQYYSFLIKHGNYVKSGSGVHFPEKIEDPIHRPKGYQSKKVVGFGTTYCRDTSNFQSNKWKSKNRKKKEKEESQRRGMLPQIKAFHSLSKNFGVKKS